MVGQNLVSSLFQASCSRSHRASHPVVGHFCLHHPQLLGMLRGYPVLVSCRSSSENIRKVFYRLGDLLDLVYLEVQLRFGCYHRLLKYFSPPYCFLPADRLVTTIPFVILWQVRIPLTKKLALTGIFSLVIITMVFAILRVTLISKLTKQPDTSWSYMWSAIEQNIAIIVACLASFRTLFTQDQRIMGGPKYGFREVSRNIISRKKPRHPLHQSISMDDTSAIDIASARNATFHSASEAESGTLNDR